MQVLWPLYHRGSTQWYSSCNVMLSICPFVLAWLPRVRNSSSPLRIRKMVKKSLYLLFRWFMNLYITSVSSNSTWKLRTINQIQVYAVTVNPQRNNDVMMYYKEEKQRTSQHTQKKCYNLHSTRYKQSHVDGSIQKAEKKKKKKKEVWAADEESDRLCLYHGGLVTQRRHHSYFCFVARYMAWLDDAAAARGCEGKEESDGSVRESAEARTGGQMKQGMEESVEGGRACSRRHLVSY